MDKRVRELRRRVSAGEIAPEEADATLIREGAYSDSAVELAALAGNPAARASTQLPEFDGQEEWLLEFNRWGHGVRVRICHAIASAALADWPAGDCDCGHGSHIHLASLGCRAPSCRCTRLLPARSPQVEALSAAEAWLAGPDSDRLEAALQAAHACSFSAPVVSVVGYALDGRPTFDWIRASLRLTPPLLTIREAVRQGLGDLSLAQSLAREEPRAVQRLPATSGVSLVATDPDRLLAESVLGSLFVCEGTLRTGWLAQDSESQRVYPVLGFHASDWPWIEVAQGEVESWTAVSARGVALGLSGGTQLRVLVRDAQPGPTEVELRAVGKALESIYWWIRSRGANNPDFDLVLQEVLGDGFNYSDLPGWEAALHLLSPPGFSDV